MSSNEIDPLAPEVERAGGSRARAALLYIGLSAAAHFLVLGLSMQASLVSDPYREEEEAAAQIQYLQTMIFADAFEDPEPEVPDVAHDGEGRSDEGGDGHGIEMGRGATGTLGLVAGPVSAGVNGDEKHLGGKGLGGGVSYRPTHESTWNTFNGGGAGVQGYLPPQIIQRTIRANFGRFHACFENDSRWAPPLFGRVSVRFVIKRDGSVLSALNAGSNVPSREVVRCVLREVSALSFPKPEGGLVTVVYPIMFMLDG